MDSGAWAADLALGVLGLRASFLDMPTQRLSAQIIALFGVVEMGTFLYGHHFDQPLPLTHLSSTIPVGLIGVSILWVVALLPSRQDRAR